MSDLMNDYGLFWNSVGGDRKYNAESFSEWLRKFFTSGVFQGDLQVTALTGMKVQSGTGYSNLEGKVRFFRTVEEFTIEPANSRYPRIDTIVIEKNTAERTITRKVVMGDYSGDTPIAKPPVRSGEIFQLVTAHIRVNAGATQINPADITDTRPDSVLCGYVTGTVEEIDFDQIMIQFNDFFDRFKNDTQNDFDAWFDAVKDQLDTDAAGHLYNLITTSITRNGNTFTAKNNSGDPLYSFEQVDDDTMYSITEYTEIPANLSAFVQGTSKGKLITYFHFRDDNNVLGLGVTWVKGAIQYQNPYGAQYGVGGVGFVSKGVDTSPMYRINIDGQNTSGFTIALTELKTLTAGSGLVISGNVISTHVPRQASGATANELPAQERMWIKEYPSGSSGLPTNNWYQIIATRSNDAKYGIQLAMSINGDAVYYRCFNNNAFGSWRSLINTDTTYGVAKQSANGLMSAGDKTKLDGVSTRANRIEFATAAVEIAMSVSNTSKGDTKTGNVTLPSGYTHAIGIAGWVQTNSQNFTITQALLNGTTLTASVRIIEGITGAVNATVRFYVLCAKIS